MDQFLWSLLACDDCILILAKGAIHFEYFFAEIAYKLHSLAGIVKLVTLRHTIGRMKQVNVPPVIPT